MMAYLIDTCILARLANSSDQHHAVSAHAVVELHRRGEALHICPQNLVEFRNAATRPSSVNGLGLSVSEAETKAAAFENTFPLLDATPDIFPAWKMLVHDYGVEGKQVHDARLVAVCHVHKINSVLTFNVSHFARFSNRQPGLNVVDPASI